jgi:nucleotide-binding universal stress UspA family protein
VSFREILAAIDSSPTAQRALVVAGELAMALNSRLTVISVAPEVSGAAPQAGVDVEGLREEVEDETQRLLREAVESLPEELPVTTVLKHGHAGERIVEQLEAGGHDLVVMGSRGRGPVVSRLFGSTAAYVHFHASVAMLVIHPEKD